VPDAKETTLLFEPVAPDVRFPDLEARIIATWREREVFKRSLTKPSPKGRYIFYEGPPTANGKPGVHHVISRIFKDIFPRFKTMQGFEVPRKGGWDTHGLPVEIAIEKRLGFDNKQQVEAYGIAKFNALCREYVFENIQEWNAMTERIAFWLDLENAYITYDPSYIESCWWIMKELWDRGLLVEDYKTTWHSPSSNTTLASHEVALGYKEDVPDPSVYPVFMADREGLRARGLIAADETREVAFLAWTTTPWTLAANTALAVHPEASYALVAGPRRKGGEPAERLYLVARDLLGAVFGDVAPTVLQEVSGSQLIGVRYQPVLRGRPDEGNRADQRLHEVIADPFVTLTDGTGIVHIAPAYGDLEVGRSHNLATFWSVDLNGAVLPDVAPLSALSDAAEGPYSGLWFKDADSAITADLDAEGLMFASGTIRHAYPFNWRDDKPLLNVAKKSWYIRTSALKEQLLENNDRIHWYPDHIRSGRFGKWLENNVDWALSRERYWGTPMPVWRAEDGDTIVVGSFAELAELSGRDLSNFDPHRPAVDEIVIERGGKRYTRVPYTVDVWFESGAMPYAQWAYTGAQATPEAAAQLAANFPADYICEAIDQTRGWFYSLHALSTLLTDPGDGERPAGPLHHLAGSTSSFKNVIVLGHIVDEKGEKMSKSKGNVVDPWSVLNEQGADALRWYLFTSSPPEATKRFSQALVEETLRDLFMTLWNTYAFFVLYANLDAPDLAAAPPIAERPEMDRWLIARIEALVSEVTSDLEAYDPTNAGRKIRDVVVDELSNWYVRLNRRRFWRGDGGADTLAAYATLHEALTTLAKLMAPFAPFISEELYQNLVVRPNPDAPDSVHLAAWPEVRAAVLDDQLLADMATLQRVVELGRSARAASKHKTRQPLPEVLVRVPTSGELKGLRRLEGALREELNVKAVRYLDPNDPFVDYQVRPNLPKVGKRLGAKIPAVRAALAEANGAAIAQAFRQGLPFELDVAGERMAFSADELLLDARSPEGYAAVEDRGVLAALRTELTPELRREGVMRDAVRLIQDARKQAGLAVSDRITLSLKAAEPEAAEALIEHRKVLAGEVLAQSVTLPGDAEPFNEAVEDFTLEAELAGGAFELRLRRTAG